MTDSVAKEFIFFFCYSKISLNFHVVRNREKKSTNKLFYILCLHSLTMLKTTVDLDDDDDARK